MQTVNLSDILQTVEKIRMERHPDLDAAFLVDVVEAEQANQEDDAEALHAVQLAVQKSLDRLGGV